MKAIRSKAVLWAVAGLVGLGASWTAARSAYAGLKETQNVTIYDSSKIAIGSLADARSSGSTVSYIRVETLSFGDNGTDMVRVTAKTGGSSSITRECLTSNDDDFMRIAAGVNGDSTVEFKWNDAGECEYIRVYNSSSLAPKVL